MHILASKYSFKVLVALFFSLMLLLTWSAVASAQSPEDAQYGAPTGPVSEEAGIGPVSGQEAVAGIGVAGDNMVGAPAAGREALVGSSALGGIVASGREALVGILPETGGSTLFFAALVAGSLAGTSLLLLRRFG